MSLVTQVSTLATRIATEFKAIRSLTGSLSSLTTTDKTSLVAAINEIDASGGGTGATNLSATPSPTQVVIASDTGADATLVAADATNAGLFLPAEKTKLAGIEALADVTDAGNVGAAVHGASTKATPVSADEIALIDTEAGNVLKKVTYGTLSSAIQTMIIDGAPGTLDTLNELAAALGDDANFAATVNTALGNRVRVDTAAQGLTGTQQTNARTNIAAAGSVEVGDTTTDFVAVFEAGLV